MDYKSAWFLAHRIREAMRDGVLAPMGGNGKAVEVDETYIGSLMSDEATFYRNVGKEFGEHGTVNHGAKEYVRGDITTNTVEGYYSIFKRGMKGVYQHCAEKHLHRYLSEFDFRYNTRVALGVDDEMRAEKALKGITGKRLTYRGPAPIDIPF